MVDTFHGLPAVNSTTKRGWGQSLGNTVHRLNIDLKLSPLNEDVFLRSQPLVMSSPLAEDYLQSTTMMALTCHLETLHHPNWWGVISYPPQPIYRRVTPGVGLYGPNSHHQLTGHLLLEGHLRQGWSDTVVTTGTCTVHVKVMISS